MNEPPGARLRVGLTGLTVAEYFRDVDHQDVLDQVAHLVDQVRGQHDRAWVLAEVLEQPVVEDLSCDSVEAEVGLIKEGQRGARGKPNDDPDGGELAERVVTGVGT